MKHGRMEGDGAMCGVVPMPAQSPAGCRCGGCPALAPPTGHGAGPQSCPQPLSGAHSPPFALSYQDSLLLSHQKPVNTQSQGKPEKRAKLLQNSQKPPSASRPRGRTHASTQQRQSCCSGSHTASHKSHLPCLLRSRRLPCEDALPARPLAFISPHSRQRHRGSGTCGTPCHGLRAGGMVKEGKAEEEQTRILPCTHQQGEGHGEILATAQPT